MCKPGEYLLGSRRVREVNFDEPRRASAASVERSIYAFTTILRGRKIEWNICISGFVFFRPTHIDEAVRDLPHSLSPNCKRWCRQPCPFLFLSSSSTSSNSNWHEVKRIQRNLSNSDSGLIFYRSLSVQYQKQSFPNIFLEFSRSSWFFRFI